MMWLGLAARSNALKTEDASHRGRLAMGLSRIVNRSAPRYRSAGYRMKRLRSSSSIQLAEVGVDVVGVDDEGLA